MTDTFMPSFTFSTGQPITFVIIRGPSSKSIQAMTSYIAVTATGDISTGSPDYKAIFAVGTVLFLMTLLMNVVSIRLVNKYREVYE